MNYIESKNKSLDIKVELLSNYIDVSNFDTKLNLYLIEYDNKSFTNNVNFIGTQEDLDYLIENGKRKPYSNEIWFMLVHKDGVKNLEKYGWLNSDYLRGLDGIDKLEIRNLQSKNLFEDIKNDNYTVIQGVINPNSKQAWKTSDGEIHCEPFIINSNIMSQLDNVNYPLDDLVDFLSEKNDIAFITNTHRFSNGKSKLIYTPFKGDELDTDLGGIISNIQHHLEEGESDPAETEEISLVYYPSKDKLKEVLFWNQDIEGRLDENRKKGIYFLERHIVRNILGAEKFFINQLELEVPKRKYKN